MIAAVELKRYMASIYIFYIIIYKFDCKQKPYQVIILLINKNTKIRIYYIVLSLDLVVHL